MADQPKVEAKAAPEKPAEHMDHGGPPMRSMKGMDHGAMIADFMRRFWVCLVISVPIVALSMMFQNLVGYHLDFPYRSAIVLVLASVIFVYGGWPFLTGMISEFRSRQFGMMTLVAVAITTAYVYSLAVTIGWLRGVDFFYELATLIDIMLLGHYIEMKSVAGASRSLELIVQMLPSDAHKRSLTLPAITDFTSIPGKGVSATVDGKKTMVVSLGYLTEKKITIPKESAGQVAETVVFILIEEKLMGFIALVLRPVSSIIV